MAATTVNIPAIVLSGGPMLDGWHEGELVGSGTVGPEATTDGSSPGTSEISRVTTRAGKAAAAAGGAERDVDGLGGAVLRGEVAGLSDVAAEAHFQVVLAGVHAATRVDDAAAA